MASSKGGINMPQDVYVDLLFLINFSMDYLCLYICARVLHRKMRLSSMLIASAIGGIYSVLSLFFVFSSAIALAIDCAVCLIMCAIVFVGRGRTARSVLLCSFLYIGISMMMGGCMTATFNLLSKLDLPISGIGSDGISTYLFAILAAIAGIISLKSGQLISKRSSAKECTLKIRFCNRNFEFSALCDSGNLVRDPISNKPVIFLDQKKLEEKLDISFFDDYAKGHLSPDSPCKNLRLMVINTATGQKMISAASPQSIEVTVCDKRGKEHSCFPDALISPSGIGKTADGHDAIVPAEIIKL